MVNLMLQMVKIIGKIITDTKFISLFPKYFEQQLRGFVDGRQLWAKTASLSLVYFFLGYVFLGLFESWIKLDVPVNFCKVSILLQ